MVPTLHDDNEDSPGKMHHFQVVDAAPALPEVVVPVKAQKPKSIQSCAMSSDLQAIMKRRRQMAETMSSETTPTASLLDTTTNNGLVHHKAKSPFHRLKTVGMSSDLQAIMARRKRLAGDDNN